MREGLVHTVCACTGEREGGREGGREGERERERESYAYHLEVTLRMWTQEAQNKETLLIIYTVTVYCKYVCTAPGRGKYRARSSTNRKSREGS